MKIRAVKSECEGTDVRIIIDGMEDYPVDILLKKSTAVDLASQILRVVTDG